MGSSPSSAHKISCPLEEKALDLLGDVASNGFLSYRDATAALSRLRVDRRLALRLLAELARRGIIKASCGHGIALLDREEAPP